MPYSSLLVALRSVKQVPSFRLQGVPALVTAKMHAIATADKGQLLLIDISKGRTMLLFLDVDFMQTLCLARSQEENRVGKTGSTGNQIVLSRP